MCRARRAAGRGWGGGGTDNTIFIVIPLDDVCPRGDRPGGGGRFSGAAPGKGSINNNYRSKTDSSHPARPRRFLAAAASKPENGTRRRWPRVPSRRSPPRQKPATTTDDTRATARFLDSSEIDCPASDPWIAAPCPEARPSVFSLSANRTTAAYGRAVRSTGTGY